MPAAEVVILVETRLETCSCTFRIEKHVTASRMLAPKYVLEVDDVMLGKERFDMGSLPDALARLNYEIVQTLEA